MREYELTFIVQPELSDEGVHAICERLDGILQKQGAIKLFYDDMGRRRLAYEIKKFQKGQYLTLFFLDRGEVVPVLERTLHLDDSVLRFLTVVGNEQVADVEARKAEAVEIERIRIEKAAERAAREAEDAARAAREAEDAARVAREAEEAAPAPAAVEAAEPVTEEAAVPDAEAAEEAEEADAPKAEEG